MRRPWMGGSQASLIDRHPRSWMLLSLVGIWHPVVANARRRLQGDALPRSRLGPPCGVALPDVLRDLPVQLRRALERDAVACVVEA